MTDSRRDRVEQRLEHMRQEFAQLKPLYKELRDNFLPGRGRFDGEKPEDRAKHRLYNSEPPDAADTLGSGLHAGLTSPARPWINSDIENSALKEASAVTEWLSELDKQMLRYFAKSNLYQVLPSMYAEYGVFGVMAALAFEDEEKLFRFQDFTIGTYYLARNEKGVFDTLYHEFPMTVRQVIKRFGENAVSERVKRMWADPKQRETTIRVLHTVEPDGNGQWHSDYWEAECQDGPRKGLLKAARARKNPILAATWQNVAGESYATACPGMKALGDAKAVQIDERDLQRAKQRHHNPPMQGPGTLRGAGISLAPGAMNWVDIAQATGQNGYIRPVHDFRPDISGLMADRDKKIARINSAFFKDLFLMLHLDDRAQPRTAEEIRGRQDEKVLMLGPTLEQSNQMLRALYDWAFAVMLAQSEPIWSGRLQGEPILPPPPQELADVEITPEFVSALQQAQRAQTLQGLERVLGAAGQVAQLIGKKPDKFDEDQWFDEYTAGVGVSPRVVRDDEEVAAMREAEAQRAQMEQMAAMAPVLKDAATAASSLASTQPQEGNLLAALGGGL